MNVRASRHRRGFREVATVAAEDLGLPRNRTSGLRLARAWAEVAGPALGERVNVLGVRRHVLELGVRDDRWTAALDGWLGAMAACLAARGPEWGITKYRIVPGDGGPLPAARPLPPVPVPVGGEAPPPSGPDPVEPEPEPPLARWQRVAAAYVECGEARRRRGDPEIG